MLVEFSPGDLVLLRQRRAGGLRLPAQGPYTFVRYRTSKRLTAEVENPLAGRLVSASVLHMPVVPQCLDLPRMRKVRERGCGSSRMTRRLLALP